MNKAWADQHAAGDLTHPVHESTLVHMKPDQPAPFAPSPCRCKCLDCRDGVHGGCQYGCR